MRIRFEVRPWLAGVALWISFPNFSLFPLAWIGLAPYLDFLCAKFPWKKVLLGHLIFSALYFGGILYWIPRVLTVYGGLPVWLAPVLYALMILGLSFFLLPFSLLTRWVAGTSAGGALAAAPGFWVITELLRNYLAANGFPWAALGYSQFGFETFKQASDLGGIYLLSGLVVFGNSALAAVFRRRDWKLPALFLATFLAANLYGFYRLYLWEPPRGTSVTVGLVQGNIQLAETRQYYAGKFFDELPALFQQAVARGAEWVILPESQNPFLFEENSRFRNRWQGLVRGSGGWLLFNGTAVDPTDEDRYFNAAYLLDPAGNLAYQYFKMELVPFGEYVPLKDWLTFVGPMVREVGGFSPGRELTVGHVGSVSFATLICYEAIFPELATGFGRKGAGILVNLTNDTWFGDTAAPRQHLEMASFRAIETRKMLLRAANSGITAVISTRGEIQSELPMFQDGVLVETVFSNPHGTLYQAAGEGLTIAFIIVSIGVGLLGYRTDLEKRRSFWKTSRNATKI